MSWPVALYLSWPWRPFARALPSGGWMVIVPGLEDFVAQAPTEDALWEAFPEQLRLHLSACLAVGEPIPFPGAPQGEGG
jgi:predicted RNase H-like HicB family nuclease